MCAFDEKTFRVVRLSGDRALLGSVVWRHSQSPSLLRPNEIHIWRSHLTVDVSSQSLLHSYLNEEENKRAARFRSGCDRARFIAARGTLRALLACYLRKRPEDLQFVFGWEGKPALAPEPAGETLSFNLSHSQDIAIFAFGRNRNIGVDVERIRPDVDCENIAHHYFSAGEMRSLAGLMRQKRLEGFFLCWTRKEAYIKACGEGLQIPLDSFDVNLEPGNPAHFLGGVDPSWRISGFMADDDYPAALVYDGPPADLQFFILDRNSGWPSQRLAAEDTETVGFVYEDAGRTSPHG